MIFQMQGPLKFTHLFCLQSCAIWPAPPHIEHSIVFVMMFWACCNWRSFLETECNNHHKWISEHYSSLVNKIKCLEFVLFCLFSSYCYQPSTRAVFRPRQIHCSKSSNILKFTWPPFKIRHTNITAKKTKKTIIKLNYV